ncbi:CRISPR-associated protein Cas2 [Clostridium sulfidigenes]|uniref:CRISPR-associated endoribonuclease Cas2 n=1 Tax=Clostridium sulfidigenes TaxID=318464 RepID=A0A084JEU6_9CLOT|nr:CRISPR-associated endonuclease Cas2 [Clostridium sulfidigenes]KEZ87480.1 CRISPR-associated protein Cas2 [Clostridium sulfidigenes]
MLYWVMYDISENRARNTAVKACKNKGLYRVQKSIFLGELNKNQKDELKIIMERLVDDGTDSIYIFPTSKDYIYDTDIIGNGFDRELISNEIVSKFL